MKKSELKIGNILFMDIVKFALLKSDQQVEIVERLDQIVTECLATLSPDERFLLIPTGDGMVVAFFDNPESPLLIARQIAIMADEKGIPLRMGLHIGPVYMVEDINKQMNLRGGGINLAQRIMDCGDLGHILASKSMVETLIQVKEEYEKFFQYIGKFKIKHGIEIDVYNVCGDKFGNPTPIELKTAIEDLRKDRMDVALLSLLGILGLIVGYLGNRGLLRTKEGILALIGLVFVIIVSIIRIPPLKRGLRKRFVTAFLVGALSLGGGFFIPHGLEKIKVQDYKGKIMTQPVEEGSGNIPTTQKTQPVKGRSVMALTTRKNNYPERMSKGLLIIMPDFINGKYSELNHSQKILENAFISHNIRVVSGEYLKDKNLLTSQERAINEGKKVNAEIVIFGKALTDFSREIQIGDFKQKFYTTSLNISAWRTSDRRLLFSKSYTDCNKGADTSALGDHDAIQRSITNCLDNISKEIVSQVVKPTR